MKKYFLFRNLSKPMSPNNEVEKVLAKILIGKMDVFIRIKQLHIRSSYNIFRNSTYKHTYIHIQNVYLFLSYFNYTENT